MLMKDINRIAAGTRCNNEAYRLNAGLKFAAEDRTSTHAPFWYPCMNELLEPKPAPVHILMRGGVSCDIWEAPTQENQ